MKKLLYLLALLPSLAFGQLGIFNKSAIIDVQLSNPAKSKVNYSGTASTSIITLPNTYTVSYWKVVSAWDTATVAASGTGRTVTWTPSWAGTNANNTYHLMIGGKSASFRQIQKIYKAEYTVFPPKHAPNVTQNLSSCGSPCQFDGGHTDRAGLGYCYTYRFTGLGDKKLNIYHMYSSDPMYPIVFEFDDVTILSNNSKQFSFGTSTNCIINGFYNDGRYGITLLRPNQFNTGENAYFELADASYSSDNFIVCGIHIDNGSYKQGGSGIIFHPPGDATFNDTNDQIDRLVIFGTLVENNANESNYIGYTTDTDIPKRSRLTNILVYRCDTNHGENEGIQIGSVTNCKIFDCKWYDCGRGGVGGQINAFVIKNGCSNLSIFHNYAITGRDITQNFPSKYGQGTEVFGNVMVSTGSGDVPMLLRLSETVVASPVYTGTWNNLVKVPIGIINQLYNDPTYYPSTTVSNYYADLNVYITNTTTNTQLYNGYDATNTIMNNATYTSTAAALFTNESANNFRPSSLSSTVFGKTRNSTTNAARVDQLQNYDIDGYRYVPSNLAAGPYSGMNLYTH